MCVFQIWCLANETRFHVNKSVDAAIRSVVLGGLQGGVQYHVEVAAGTSAGVGARSEPQPIIIGNVHTHTHMYTHTYTEVGVNSMTQKSGTLIFVTDGGLEK